MGPIGLQPSEIAKWAVPVLLAWYAVSVQARRRRAASPPIPRSASAPGAGMVIWNVPLLVEPSVRFRVAPIFQSMTRVASSSAT
ncbi:MAG: hypothetical protein ACKOHI_00595 [Phycisphaerales bacterium]